VLNLLVPLASLLGLETDALIDKLKESAVAWSAIVFFALVGIVFLLIAANTGLTFWVGPIWAPLIIAGVALLVALIVFLVAGQRRNALRRRAAEEKRSHESTALLTTAAITALPLILKSPLMKSVGIPIGGALAAAYLLSRPSKHPPKS
jgi:uncharacterized integral membrane protein